MSAYREREPSPPPEGRVSPLHSVGAILAGFAVNWFLVGLSSGALGAIFPDEFPTGDPPIPTSTGLVLITITMALNGTLAGLLAGRLAPMAPVAHAGVLAGVFGMYALTGMDQAHGYPGWFALAFAIVPPAGCVLGGVIARAGEARRKAEKDEGVPAETRRGQATAIPLQATEDAEASDAAEDDAAKASAAEDDAAKASEGAEANDGPRQSDDAARSDTREPGLGGSEPPP